MEKDYIIISTVRSNLSGKIGFLSETKRLDVALTRAKKGVIVLGSAECLAKKNGIWRDFISFYYSKNLIFQGPLSNLVPVPKDEIFITDIESAQEEECEIIKIEKHKEVKKEIICDYFKSWDAAPPAPAAKAEIKNEIKNDIKDYDEIIIEHKSTAEEEKEDEEDIKDWKIKKNKNKNKKKNSNKNSEEEEEEKKVVEEKKNANNKKIKKEKESKNTIVTEVKEDKKNKKKGNKKYLDESSSDNDEKKSKKRGKNKRK